jgi:hypothetical protein
MEKNSCIIKELLSEASGQVLPLVIKPACKSVNISQWVIENKQTFTDDLLKHGGILLRGFDVQSIEAFNDFMKCFNTEPLPYMFRSSPRREVKEDIKNIYTSTIYPNERRINMHCESSYSRVWGAKIVFCCITPATSGGETPIADTRKVLRDIDKEIVNKFRAKGVTYRRNLFPDLGMPWQEVFQTNDFNIAKDVCAKNDIRYRFVDEDQVVLEWTKPAVYCHPVSGEEVWFNHAYFFNKYSRYDELGLGADECLPSEYLTSDTFFGDGTEISYDEYAEIGKAYDKNKVIFPYQKGDVIFLDNMLAAHGRNPYVGERLIATAIIEATYDSCS